MYIINPYTKNEIEENLNTSLGALDYVLSDCASVLPEEKFNALIVAFNKTKESVELLNQGSYANYENKK